MLDKIVVDCSPITNVVRIGRKGVKPNILLEWEDRTDEIIGAVADHLLEIALKRENKQAGYQWDMKDGGKMTLRLTVEKGANDGEINR